MNDGGDFCCEANNTILVYYGAIAIFRDKYVAKWTTVLFKAKQIIFMRLAWIISRISGLFGIDGFVTKLSFKGTGLKLLR